MSRHSHHPTLERLEDRLVPAAVLTANLTSGVLTIEGTEAADRVVVRQVSGQITVEGISIRVGSTLQTKVASNAVSTLKVYGLGGNDFIALDSETKPGQQPLTVPAFVYAGEGQDTIRGGWGADWLYGGNGLDTIYGNKGNDILQGEGGADLVYGDDGNDRIWGNAGNDFLYGGLGNDDLYGGEGDDYLDGSSGLDILAGENGFDSYRDDFDLTKPFYLGTATTDIIQQVAPTCVTLTGLAELVQSGVNLSDRIRYLGNGLYDVKMYKTGGWYYERVAFNGTWNDNDPAPSREGQGRTLPEFWTILFQRARLQLFGVNYRNSMTSQQWQDANLKSRGLLLDAGEALYNFTGKVAEYHYANLVTPQTLSAANQQGRLIVVNTPGTGSNSTLDASSGIVAWHAYSVTRVYQSGGQWQLELYNPWGRDGNGTPRDGKNDGFLTITWNEFAKFFRSARIV